jgi:hypothetical protein
MLFNKNQQELIELEENEIVDLLNDPILGTNIIRYSFYILTITGSICSLILTLYILF